MLELPQTRTAAAYRYRAFLSYSHRDMAWAKWLHRTLEVYRIDRDLVGRETAHGPVPKTLRPIFRDREDFSAGHSLTEQTVAALEASQFLVVICSPHAAQSVYVNEEIRCFKALGRAACVIPVIVDGAPGEPEHECFPPALRFKIDADGALTSERESPIAADARPQGDGKEIAKQKVVAGLLGLGLDEIMRRAVRARKRRNIVRTGAGVACVVVVVAAALGWWGSNSLYLQLRSAEDVNFSRDTADICEGSRELSVAEEWRIALAAECVKTFVQVLADVPPRTRVPARVLSSFRESVALLQKFRDEGKLTPEQSELLTKGEIVMAKLAAPRSRANSLA
jgi:hypothetical protein